MIKRFITDPSLWLLLAINAYAIYYYQHNPNSFKTIIWLYWCQSVMIGIFNVVFLLTIKNAVSPMLVKNIEGKTNIQGRSTTALFFLLHYGAFHFVYMIFLFATVNKGIIDYQFLLLGLAIFFLSATIDFIRKKIREQSTPVSIGTVFFLPYLRIIPMHFMFLLPAFFGWEISATFLVCKTIADIAMYMLTKSIEQRKTVSIS